MQNRFALSPEHLNVVERFVALGRYAEPHAVISAALALLEGREQERTARLSALHAALAEEMEPAADAPMAAAPIFASISFDVDATFREIERLLSPAPAVLREAC